MIRYFRTTDGYIAVTDQSPAGFEGLVFVGRGGPIDNIQEQLFPADQLTDPVDVADVDPSWVQALGFHKVEDFPLLDEAGENLVAEIPVRVPREPVTTTVVRWFRGPVANWLFGHKDQAVQVGYLIGIVLILYLFVFRQIN